MKRVQTKVFSNRAVAEGYMELVFHYPPHAPPPRAGQFVSILPEEGNKSLLRRPFALASFEQVGESEHKSAADESSGIATAYGEFRASIVYQIRGDMTRSLARKVAGEYIDVITPLGVAFTTDNDNQFQNGVTTDILIAGGIGFGPMRFLARQMLDEGRKPLFIFGARNPSLVPERGLLPSCPGILALESRQGETDSSLNQPGTETMTDWEEFSGTVTQALSAWFSRQSDPADSSIQVFACGPAPMLKALHRMRDNHGFGLWVSMEQTMGCGVGACMGCAVELSHGAEHGDAQKSAGKHYARVCTEGPVFNSRDIAWESI